MSLLMDALKKAEADKQEAARSLAGREGGPPAADDDGLSLAPLPGDAPGKALPELSEHLAAVDADLAAAAMARPAPAASGSTAAPPRSPDPAQDRDSIRQAFAVKAPPSRRQTLLGLVGLLGLAALLIGGYVWYQMQSLNQSGLNRPSPQRTAPPATPPFAQELPATPPSSPPALPVPPAPRIFAPAKPSTAAPGEALTPPPRRRPPAAAEAPAAIRILRTPAEPDATLLRAHRKLQDNTLDAARQDYELALRRDPNNVDTLLGLAAIAQHQGRQGDAERFRQRALVAAPHDPAAQAAALGSQGNADPLATESRLKSLLSAQPESPALNFALGNLYARQGRWSDAQPAYFNAVAADADNPDYLFNLAVSLDHLRQPRLAAQHYRLALDAARQRAAAFDHAAVSRRLGELHQP